MATKIINSIIGGNSAKKAGSQAADAQNRAADEQRRQYETSKEDINAQKSQNRSDLSPFLNTGTNANNQLDYLLGLGGNDLANGVAGGAGSLAKPFTMADYEADPGYKFRLEQGMKALDRAKSAGGKYFSGGAIKGLTDYNQNAASGEFKNAYDRYTQNQNNLFNRLSGVSQSGQNAANSLISSGNQLTLGNAGLGANATNQIANNMTNAGDYHAAGTLGQGQAWQTGLGAIGDTVDKIGGSFLTGLGVVK